MERSGPWYCQSSFESGRGVVQGHPKAVEHISSFGNVSYKQSMVLVAVLQLSLPPLWCVCKKPTFICLLKMPHPLPTFLSLGFPRGKEQ